MNTTKQKSTVGIYRVKIAYTTGWNGPKSTRHKKTIKVTAITEQGAIMTAYNYIDQRRGGMASVGIPELISTK